MSDTSRILHAAPDPEAMTKRWRWENISAVLFVLIFAFLIASSPIRNSDFWMHLASGRLIATGGCQLGVDPFAYTTQGVYWANHAWVFDFGLYELYSLLGGNAVVVLKGVLGAIIAAILLCCRRPLGGWGVPVLSTTLALAVVSPRFFFQPALLSILLLALTITLLLRRHGRRLAWSLLPLFVLWVNLDEWFLLGPLTVAAFLLGERIGLSPTKRRVPAWLLPAALAACLVSPYHIRGFVLPSEVSPAVFHSGLAQDPRFERYFQSPWTFHRYRDSDSGLNPAGLGYFGLLLLSMISFTLHRPALRDGRFSTWIAFSALGAWNLRLVPFFAVVAGPILTLNLQDWAAQRVSASTTGPPRLVWRSIARLGAALVTCLLLLGLAWSGWLYASPGKGRRVAWEVQPDPGLRQAAERRARWRASGLLDDSDRAFHIHPDSAHYAAWFCPAEKTFLDLRLNLFSHVAREYRTLSQALGIGAPARESFPGEAESILRNWRVSYLVLHDPDVNRLQTALRSFWDRPENTPLIQLEGREATFGWGATTRKGVPFERWRLDLDSVAFIPARMDDRVSPAAPGEGAGRTPQPSTLWNDFSIPAHPRSVDADTAALLLGYVDDQTTAQAPAVMAERIARYTASFVGASSPGAEPLSAALLTTMRIELGQDFLPPLDAVSPSPALLAIRAARRAIVENPDDAESWLRLGQAYVALTYSTREHLWANSFRPLGQLRHVQAVCALERAVLLDPNLESAHALLALVYAERRMLDASVYHLREQVRIARGRKTSESARRLDELAKVLAEKEAQLQDRRAEFAIRSQGLVSDPLARAHIALGLGLSLAALDEVLLTSEVILFGVEGARLELELLLMLGRPDRARFELESAELRQNSARLGSFSLPGPGRPDRPPYYTLPAYVWGRFLRASADGDYERAGEALAEFHESLDEARRSRTHRAEVSLPLFIVTEIGLGARQETRWVTILLGRERQAVMIFKLLNRIDLQVEADLHCLAGILSLERGLPDDARRHFNAAIQAASAADVRGMGFTSESMCHAYLQRIKAARK